MGKICYNCFKQKNNDGACPFCGYDAQKDEGKYPLALTPGSILMGKYIVGRVLGQGGFGATYIAQEHDSGRMVAIKEYLPGELATRTGTYGVTAFSGDRAENFEYGKKCFLDEAKTIAQFNDIPNIVNVYNFFEENNTAYFTMEYVHGTSLQRYMTDLNRCLTVDEASRILVPVMRAVGKVHKEGIIHRDIAPDNIIVDEEGNAKLIDFGAARYSTGEKSKSLDVVLKHGFAPREQYSRHGKQGPFTDVYAMAATYYYAITGKVPPESIDRMEDDQLILPSTFGVEISDAVEDALLHALAVSPADRIQSMEEFADEMEAGIRYADPETLIGEAFGFLKQKRWKEAEKLLNELEVVAPHAQELHLGRLLAELNVEQKEFLAFCKEPFDGNANYARILECGDPRLKNELKIYLNTVRARQAGTAEEKKNVEALIEEAFSLLAQKRWSEAEAALDIAAQAAPDSPRLYLGRLMADLKVDRKEALALCKKPFDNNPNYNRILTGNDMQLKEELAGYLAQIRGPRKPGKFAIAGVAGLALVLVAAGVMIFASMSKQTATKEVVTWNPVQSQSSSSQGSSTQGSAAQEPETQEPAAQAPAAQEPELIMKLFDVSLSAKAESENHYKRLNAVLEPNQVYTLCFEKITVTAGKTDGIGVRVFDFTPDAKKKTLYTALIDISQKNGEYRCVLRTPETIGEDTDIALYAGIQGKTQNVGIDYEGIALYKGEFAEEKPKAVGKPELVFAQPELSIPPHETSQYCFRRLNVTLKPSTVYTLYFDAVEVNEGTTVGVGVRVFNFDKNKTLCTEIVEITNQSGGYTWVFQTPEDLGEDPDIVLYSGIQSQTMGVGVTYKGIRLYEGVYQKA